MTATTAPVSAGAATLAELTHALQAAAALAAAAATGAVTALNDGPASAQEVARTCGTSPRHTELLLVALQALGVVDGSADGTFRRTDTPLDFLERTRQDWACAEDVVRTGRSLHQVDTPSGAQQLYPSVVPGLSVLGARAATVAARALAPAGRVLDAGAGAAPWSIAVAGADPSARITALDLAPVLETTRAQVAAAGLSDRFTFEAGDLLGLVPEPAGHDVVLLANVCHLFDDVTNADLVARLSGALAPGGDSPSSTSCRSRCRAGRGAARCSPCTSSACRCVRRVGASTPCPPTSAGRRPPGWRSPRSSPWTHGSPCT